MSRTDAMGTPAALRDLAAFDGAQRPARRVYGLGRHWAVAVNQKILSALGLAALAWAAIATAVAALMH